MIFTEENFVNLIRSAEGTPYKFGGIDPFHGGADCSGLIYWAALQCGVTLPRTTQAEWQDLPHSTNLAAMPIGGCVEFEVPNDGGSPPQHVGVNIGGGFMIDDPMTGEVVSVQAIPNVPGVIWPIGWVQLPFVITPPTPIPPPPLPKDWKDMGDSVVAENGDIVSHAETPSGHYLEITRSAGKQGLPANQGLSIIDFTAQYPGFVVEGVAAPTKKISQRVSSIIRQVGSLAISAAYAGLLAAGQAKQIPTAVDTAIVAFGPAMIILEHFLSDPSTGNPT